MVWLQLNQHVHVTAGTEVPAKCGPEEREFLYPPLAAEVSDTLRVYLDSECHCRRLTCSRSR